MRPPRARVILSTASSVSEAKKIGEALVRERLAACVTFVPGIQSVYSWKGKMERSREVFLVIKTQASRYRALEKRLRALHSYEVPEVLSLPISEGSAPYLRWLSDNSRGRP